MEGGNVNDFGTIRMEWWISYDFMVNIIIFHHMYYTG